MDLGIYLGSGLVVNDVNICIVVFEEDGEMMGLWVLVVEDVVNFIDLQIEFFDMVCICQIFNDLFCGVVCVIVQLMILFDVMQLLN